MEPTTQHDPFRPARARRGPIWYLVPLAAVLLLLLVGATRFLRPRNGPSPVAQTARLTVLAPPVEARTAADGAWAPVTAPMTLSAGAGIRTGEAGRAELVFEDGSLLRMNANAEIAVQALPAAHRPTTSVQLLVGEVWSRLLNLGASGTYQVDGGQALALVRGTAFSASRSADRFSVAAVQHDVLLQLKDGGASASVSETRRAEISFADPKLKEARALPTEAQDLAFLQSAWRKANLEADLRYLEELSKTRPELADEARAAIAHARCLLDVQDCEGGPAVRELRTSVVDNVATAFLTLHAWDGRPLQLVWKRDGTTVRETTVRPQPGDLLAEDRLEIAGTGAYAVEALLDRVAVNSARFEVAELSSIPAEPPSSSEPPQPGVCRAYDATAFCGTKQYYADRDADCVFEACVTCPAGRVGSDANQDGYADGCAAPAPASPAPVASSAPSSSPSCPDPGTCRYGWDRAACSCKIAPAPACGDNACNGAESCSSCARDCGSCGPVCGNGTAEAGEACEPPGTNTCSASCQRVVVPVATCGNGTVEGGEQCDPPDGRTCDASCRVIAQQPVCGNGKVESGEACEPPNTSTCSSSCQAIVQTFSSPPPQTAPVCGNGTVESGEQCEPPDTRSCDKGCQAIIG